MQLEVTSGWRNWFSPGSRTWPALLSGTHIRITACVHILPDRHAKRPALYSIPSTAVVRCIARRGSLCFSLLSTHLHSVEHNVKNQELTSVLQSSHSFFLCILHTLKAMTTLVICFGTQTANGAFILSSASGRKLGLSTLFTCTRQFKETRGGEEG